MLAKRVFVGVAVAAAGIFSTGAVASQAAPPSPGSGTHGCILADVNGTPAPVAYPNSGTSQIGGSTCTDITVVPTANPPGGGEGYEAAAASWSIAACVPVAGGACTPDPAHSYSSASGSAPVADLSALPAGDVFTATVKDGTLVVGTPNGAPGT